jgi:hypothetical protein
MGPFKLGSTGDEVRQIQQALESRGLYAGDLDGIYGAPTAAGVEAFQRRSSLTPDGVVGPLTWTALVGAPAAAPALAGRPVAERCLALTGSFETSAAAPACFSVATGDFDGMGMSFGALQWNLGSGTLQPIFQGMLDQHAEVMRGIFQDRLPAVSAAVAGGRDQALSWARSIQDSNTHRFAAPWRDLFAALGATPECQALQMQAASSYRKAADRLLASYQLWSERGSALAFDLMVQNGGIPAAVNALVRSDIAALGAQLSDEDREVAKMKILANRRAEAARPAYVEDVRNRKLCIALGTGTVHGRAYDLAADYGIELRRLPA